MKIRAKGIVALALVSSMQFVMQFGQINANAEEPASYYDDTESIFETDDPLAAGQDEYDETQDSYNDSWSLYEAATVSLENEDLALTQSETGTVYSVSGYLDQAKPTVDEILAKYSEVTSISPTSIYTETPSIVSPYSSGELDDAMLQTGLTYLNYVRYIAGL
jgi:hypothetical protein